MSAAKPIEIYQYPNCSTCRKALKWLDAQGVAYRSVDIVARPPSKATLAKVMKLAGVELRKLFNTSGQSYRQGDWKQKLTEISTADALAALAADGKLIKRPLVVGEDFALIGFRPDDWAETLAS
ncbi:Spx/MgsR family RNA polymerase-binding regulatory protein [Enhygromyxa salina]|uniref:Regulatory protein MgsR n=1 Tax=Enhygromyxa salina TaxID=215803 RepID=A0A2S9XLD8_9BACT|nr:Spx/MgsR family RNA polymerase-binding regulatory protein [Enhygromyxa salina]PRP93689.1 Regulatory protein MgsR [Enhygromyxa salina]